MIREYRLSDASVVGADSERWLQWTVLSYEQLEALHQPPYGDRAIVLRETGSVIGACGYSPQLMPFGLIPGFASGDGYTAEVGLYWAITTEYQRRGFATEAGHALIDYAFESLALRRIVATTTYDNEPSIGVMRKLGMRIERNPQAEPEWFQIVSYLDNPAHRGAR